MSLSANYGNILIRAYSLVRRTGFLCTPFGRKLFKSAYFLYKRHVEDDLQELLQSFPDLVKGGSALDVGANIGYTAAVLARAIEPDYRVYAFEPEAFNFSILQQTANESEFEGRIVPIQCAVGLEPGTIELWINEHHHADHRVLTDQLRSEQPVCHAVKTRLVSVDSFLQNKPEKVAFIKIDVQGYELAVCQGMQETLRRNPDITVVLEFMPSAMRELGFDPAHLIDLFVERGFGVYLIHPRGKLSRWKLSIPSGTSYCNLLFSCHSFA